MWLFLIRVRIAPRIIRRKFPFSRSKRTNVSYQYLSHVKNRNTKNTFFSINPRPLPLIRSPYSHPTRIRERKSFLQQTEKKLLALIRECDMTTSPLRKYMNFCVLSRAQEYTQTSSKRRQSTNVMKFSKGRLSSCTHDKWNLTKIFFLFLFGRAGKRIEIFK